MNQLNAPAISTLTQTLRNAFAKADFPCTVTPTLFRSGEDTSALWQAVRFEGVPEFRLFSKSDTAAAAAMTPHLSAGMAALAELLNASLKTPIQGVDIESVAVEPEDLQISWRIEGTQVEGVFEIALDGPAVVWASANLPISAPAPNAPPSMLDTLLDVELPVSILLASREASLDDVMRWGPGAIVEFDAGLDDPVDVIVNKRIVARGSVVLVDGNYGVRITEVLGGAGTTTWA